MASFPQDWGSAAFSLLRTYQARGIWIERLKLVPCEELRISTSFPLAKRISLNRSAKLDMSPSYTMHYVGGSVASAFGMRFHCFGE